MARRGRAPGTSCDRARPAGTRRAVGFPCALGTRRAGRPGRAARPVGKHARACAGPAGGAGRHPRHLGCTAAARTAAAARAWARLGRAAAAAARGMGASRPAEAARWLGRPTPAGARLGSRRPRRPGRPARRLAPAPAKSGGNGCLKGCLIVGGIGVVLLIIVFIVLTIFAQRFAADLGIGPDGTLTECSIISSSDLSDALKGDAEALPLGGIVDATIGQLLDKRVIPDADDCWIAGENTATGRIARQSGNGSGSFNSARDAAQIGGYFAGDVSGVGDEAFCTGMSEAGSFGVLVRRGDTLVYVSLINASITTGSGFETNQDGVITSPETCDLAGKVAAKVR